MKLEAKDILEPPGFVRMICAILQLVPGGLVSCGMVCSSFSLVNRGLVQISPHFHPLGLRM